MAECRPWTHSEENPYQPKTYSVGQLRALLSHVDWREHCACLSRRLRLKGGTTKEGILDDLATRCSAGPGRRPHRSVVVPPEPVEQPLEQPSTGADARRSRR